jgi:hypothetical protein
MKTDFLIRLEVVQCRLCMESVQRQFEMSGTGAGQRLHHELFLQRLFMFDATYWGETFKFWDLEWLQPLMP